MEFESTQNNTTVKLPILKLGEYEMWVIRIKQYFQVQDYALWEVIENGNSWVSVPQTTQENGVSVTKMLVSATAKENINKNDVKARSLLLMALPNEHQLTFSVVVIQEDLNSKFLRSLPPEWNTHVVVWMNKANIETMSIDDLTTTLKLSNKITVSTNVNNASPQVSTANFSDNVVYAFMVENLNSSNLLQQDLEQIHEDYLEAMDLRDSKQESNTIHDQKSDDSKENYNNSFVKEQVSEDTSSFVKSPLNVDKETAFSVDKKIEFVKSKNYDKPVRKSVRASHKRMIKDLLTMDALGTLLRTYLIYQILRNLMEVMLHLGEEHVVVDFLVKAEYSILHRNQNKLKERDSTRSALKSKQEPMKEAGTFRIRANKATHAPGASHLAIEGQSYASVKKLSSHRLTGFEKSLDTLFVVTSFDFEKYVFARESKNTSENEEIVITATIDGKVKYVSEPSIRRHLKLEDSNGISSLPNTKFFEQLALMGASKGYNGVDIPLFPTMPVYGQIDQGVESTVPVESYHTSTNAPSTSQQQTSTPSIQTTHDVEEPATMPHDLPLPMTKLTYDASYTKLILRVKKLEHKVKTSQHRRRAKVVLSDDEEDLKDLSKQGREISKIDENPSISLILLDQEEPTELEKDLGSGEKGEKEISTFIPEVSTAAENLVYIRRSAEKRKDKEKAIIEEDKSIQKKSKKQLEQERLGHEEAIRLQEQIFKEERQRIARDAEIAKQLQEAIAKADSAHDIDWNDPIVLRYHALQNRPFPKAEVRKNMCTYLKNHKGYKQSYFGGLRYEDIRPIFERQVAEEVSEKKDDSNSKPFRGSRKKTVTKKRISAKLDEESAKRQKLKDVTEDEATTEYKKEKEELRLSLKINHNDKMEKKYPLINELLEKMLILQLEAEEESTIAFELIKLSNHCLKNSRVFGRILSVHRRFNSRNLII
nr:hypothetical protein [Tanacetum cinerariifolium]